MASFRAARVSKRFPAFFQQSLYGGGMYGILGLIGSRAFALMLVASRAVRMPRSRPGSAPLFCTSSSPRVVPGVCDGISVLLLWFVKFEPTDSPFRYECAPNIDEWRVSRIFPSPRYMCTPQGRHGSKLLTARMISMPLKLSGPFSSKIGVF